MKTTHTEASAWFDGLYQENRESQEKIPWAKQAVNPLLQSYLDEVLEHKGSALVIGCGLGDDARALELAKERFPNSKIVFKEQDIFEYEEQFDFVFEAFTIQSLPVEFREKMVESVANRVTENGKLLLVAHQREQDFDGPPWPLTLEEVKSFEKHELKELSCEIHREASAIAGTRFRVLYGR